MSEIKLNIVDQQTVLHGTLHGSQADAAVAALAAEPETVDELRLAVMRFEKYASPAEVFSWFGQSGVLDPEPWDAGIMVIDLAARVVATESTYSLPGQKGHVNYHDGEKSTDLVIPYRLSDEWQFYESLELYEGMEKELRAARLAKPLLDARQVMYGRPLLEFIATEVRRLVHESSGNATSSVAVSVPQPIALNLISGELEASPIIRDVHTRWLKTPRKDLGGLSPRDLLLARQEFIDFDLDSRELQWSFLNEGPPLLPVTSNAYRYAGFGTHEWVVYYDLVRHLLSHAKLSALAVPANPAAPGPAEGLINQLDLMKTQWLESPNPDYSNRTPAVVIDNERRRLPMAMSARDMVVDEDCPICRAMIEDPDLSQGVGFWHLDSSGMDDDFVFSSFRTVEEWEADRRIWQGIVG